MIVGEALALARSTDREQPLTYYIRWLMRATVFGRLVVWALLIAAFIHFEFNVR